MIETLNITEKMLDEFRVDHSEHKDERKRCAKCEVFLTVGIQLVEYMRSIGSLITEANMRGYPLDEEVNQKLRSQYEDWWKNCQGADKNIRWHLDRNVRIENLDKFFEARNHVLERIAIYESGDVLESAHTGGMFDGIGITED